MKINLSGKNFNNVVVDMLGVDYTCDGHFKVDYCDANKLNTLKKDSDYSKFELFTGCDYLKLEVGDVVNGNLNVQCEDLDMYEMEYMSYRMKLIRNEIKTQLNIEDLDYIDLSIYGI